MQYRATKLVKPFPHAASQWAANYPGALLYPAHGYGNNLAFLGFGCYARAGTFPSAACIGSDIYWYNNPSWFSSTITSYYSTSHVAVADHQGETSGFPYVTRFASQAADWQTVARWLLGHDEHMTGLKAAGVLPWQSVIRWGYLWSTWWNPSEPWTNFPFTNLP